MDGLRERPFLQLPRKDGAPIDLDADAIAFEAIGRLLAAAGVPAELEVAEDRVLGIAGGTYLYDPADHRLIVLAEGSKLDRAAFLLRFTEGLPAGDLGALASSLGVALRPTDLPGALTGDRARPAAPVEVERFLVALWKDLLRRDDVELDQPFFDLGGTSLLAAVGARRLQERFPGAAIQVDDLFSHPTIRELTAYVERVLRGPAPATQLAKPAPAPAAAGGPVAIVALACRFPGAPDPERFWDLLRSGATKVEPVPEARRALVPGFIPRKDQRYLASWLEDIERFDPLFFRISPREAERMDPSQRILLELVVELLSSAGLLGGQLAGTRTGVYLGAGPTGYLDLARGKVTDLEKVLSGNMAGVSANRISHFLDVRGPSLTVDTACSSSLVALDMAFRAVQSGEAEMAIAGGVNLILSPEGFDAFRQDGMESPSGRCANFDAAADGTVRGEGAGLVLLKPLARALADGDTVRAVIRGSAVNHAGRTNALAVPSAPAQAEVIATAHARAGTAPSEVSLIEAGGTGTALGDPIEVRGLLSAFGDDLRKASCGLGSVKTNLGHLEYASGIAALIKVVLALEHREIPPTLNFSRPNPAVSFERSPFFVADRARPWTSARPRLAGVSSFSVGGVNAHVILEEAPPLPRTEPARRTAERPAHLLALSAATRESLLSEAEAVLGLIGADPTLELADLCASANTGRPELPHRLAIVARTLDQLSDRLALFVLGDGKRPLAGSLIFAGQAGADPDPAAARRIEVRLARLPAGAVEALPADLGEAEWLDVLSAIAERFVQGAPADLGALGRPRRRVTLPPVAFQRERIWWPHVLGRAPEAPAPASDARSVLIEMVGGALGIPRARVDTRQPLVEMGMDSVSAMALLDQLNAAAGERLEAAFFYENPTIEKMADALAARKLAVPRASQVGSPRSARSGAIAVIGMAGRFPGADSVPALWDLLLAGRDAVTEIPRERFDVNRFYDPDRQKVGKTYCKWGGTLGDIDRFDPLFFRMSDREARWLDPQQRLLLECAKEGIEDAGYGGSALAGSTTGVFVGVSYTHYRDKLARSDMIFDEVYPALGSSNGILVNRLSYFLDLHGPNVAVDALCASSLVALQLAVKSLRTGECDQALVGAVHAGVSAEYYQGLSRLQAISPRGRCHTFDRDADGYVPGEGVAVVMLKPLEAALRDGDHVRAVIRGAAVNHGGTAAGLTVPNPVAQAMVVRSALADAGLSARDVSYVECHGTGTSIGDPLEVSALTEVYGAASSDRMWCGLGSVKTNLGHLEPAAGLAGLIKLVLALEHRTLPASLHLTAPNPRIAFADSPFFVVDRALPWRAPGGLRAGISSFGIGGVNAHAVVEEAPPAAAAVRPRSEDRAAHALVLSARSAASLLALVRAYAERIARDPELDVRDVCFTAATGRPHMRVRLGAVARGRAELLARLAGAEAMLARGEARADGPMLFMGTTGQVAREAPPIPEWRSLSPESAIAALAALAAHHVAGGEVAWRDVDAGFVRRRVPLPGSPFERKLMVSEIRERVVLPPEEAHPLLEAVAVEHAPSRNGAHPLLGAASGDVFEVEL